METIARVSIIRRKTEPVGNGVGQNGGGGKWGKAHQETVLKKGDQAGELYHEKKKITSHFRCNFDTCVRRGRIFTRREVERKELPKLNTRIKVELTGQGSQLERPLCTGEERDKHQEL